MPKYFDGSGVSQDTEDFTMEGLDIDFLEDVTEDDLFLDNMLEEIEQVHLPRGVKLHDE